MSTKQKSKSASGYRWNSNNYLPRVNRLLCFVYYERLLKFQNFLTRANVISYDVCIQGAPEHIPSDKEVIAGRPLYECRSRKPVRKMFELKPIQDRSLLS